MKNITQAMIKVMQEVESIDKNLNVGTGRSSYKGVADKDVKLAVGKAMQKHGLVIVPTAIDPKVTSMEWDETYNGEKKHRTQYFTEVLTKYLVIHVESGEYLELAGYGHGVDSQDKSAGKATTYALKNTLLYTFLIPTGDIDDTDATHSEQIVTPPKARTQTGLTATCPIHKFMMTRYEKDGNEWWSHKLTDGTYCYGKTKKQ